MEIKEFIERAIESGWEHKHPYPNDEQYWDEFTHAYMLLDPAAWKAVGRVEGWGDFRNMTNNMWAWHHKMHEMVTALAEGKTIEEFLATL